MSKRKCNYFILNFLLKKVVFIVTLNDHHQDMFPIFRTSLLTLIDFKHRKMSPELRSKAMKLSTPLTAQGW